MNYKMNENCGLMRPSMRLLFKKIAKINSTKQFTYNPFDVLLHYYLKSRSQFRFKGRWEPQRSVMGGGENPQLKIACLLALKVVEKRSNNMWKVGLIFKLS